VGEGLKWSPDGSRLIFEQAEQLAILHHDGTGPRLVPRLTQWDGDPAWSPDGRRLVFAGNVACLYCRCSIPSPRRHGLRLIGRAGAYSPAWSTRGRIAFANDDDQYLLPVPPTDALYTVKPDGSRLRKLFGRYWGERLGAGLVARRQQDRVRSTSPHLQRGRGWARATAADSALQHPPGRRAGVVARRPVHRLRPRPRPLRHAVQRTWPAASDQRSRGGPERSHAPMDRAQLALLAAPPLRLT
jgi:hypothetical protein